MTSDNSRELTLQGYVDILRRRWFTILAILALAVVGWAFAAITQVPSYEASAEVVLRTPSTNRLFPSVSDPSNRLMRDTSAELTYVQTDLYRQAVADALGRRAEVSVKLADDGNTVDTGRLQFTNIDPSPERAAEAAQTHAEVYMSLRTDFDVSDIERQLAEAQDDQARLLTELEALRGPVDEIDAEIAATSDLDEQSALATQRLLIMSQLGADIGQLESSLSQAEGQVERLTDARETVAEPGMTAFISRAANVPTSSVSRSGLQTLSIALAVGLVLGVGAALLRDTLDTRVASDHEADGVLGYPVLASIPKVATKRASYDPGLAVYRDPEGRLAQGYHRVRTALEFASIDADLKTILVTSPNASEGKSTTASNLALAMATVGSRTVLVDTDFRRGRVHRIFGFDQVPGLADNVLYDIPVTSAAHRIEDPGLSSLLVVPTGTTPPSPASFVGTTGFAKTINWIRDNADVCVLDAPPLLAVSDAFTIARDVDVVILVVRAGETTKPELTEAVNGLRQVGANLLGVVMIGVAPKDGYGKNYSSADPENIPSQRTRLDSDLWKVS